MWSSNKYYVTHTLTTIDLELNLHQYYLYKISLLRMLPLRMGLDRNQGSYFNRSTRFQICASGRKWTPETDLPMPACTPIRPRSSTTPCFYLAAWEMRKYATIPSGYSTWVCRYTYDCPRPSSTFVSQL